MEFVLGPLFTCLRLAYAVSQPANKLAEVGWKESMAAS